MKTGQQYIVVENVRLPFDGKVRVLAMKLTFDQPQRTVIQSQLVVARFARGHLFGDLPQQRYRGSLRL